MSFPQVCGKLQCFEAKDKFNASFVKKRCKKLKNKRKKSLFLWKSMLKVLITPSDKAVEN